MQTITAWFPGKDEDMCEQECPVTNAEFLKEQPTDLDLRRLSLLYTKKEIREFAQQLGLSSDAFHNLLHIEKTETWKFEVIRKCQNSFALTFRHIKEAFERANIPNIHRLCKVHFDESKTYI
ncbi:uncharacterized protein LOC143059414 [Mytilus galloprovincialis]|uniref:uncharacterized protein LOC143059414 n=1 Tax=Mytilus galloprovincialis TaxID=29158 RepID=UPI003F7C65AB